LLNYAYNFEDAPHPNRKATSVTHAGKRRETLLGKEEKWIYLEQYVICAFS